MKTTTVQVTEETWSRLNGLKESGQSMDDVITELLVESGE